MNIFHGITTAFRTLSILPAPGRDAERFSDALYWFPVVGLVLGGILALSGMILAPLSAPITAVILLIEGTLLTRGFHLDGLADCADGFGGGHTSERVLEIMKDSHVGAFGVMALVLNLLLKAVCLHGIIRAGAWSWIPLAYMLSRMGQVGQIVEQPYARRQGIVSRFIEGAERKHRNTVWLIGLLLGIGLLGIRCGIAAWGIAVLLQKGIGVYSRRRIGGITGDVLGATSEILEAALLLLGACAVGRSIG